MIGVYNYTVITTYVSLLSSILGIFFGCSGQTFPALLCLMASGALDSFDGKIASMKKNRTVQEKRFGIQIDSLCDLVCFGVLPCVIGYSLGMQSVWYMPVMGFFILGAISRLAYFNVDEEERQDYTDEKRKYYEGLPVTATALIFPALYLCRYLLHDQFVYAWTICMLLVAALFMIRFKIIKPGMRGVLLQVLFGVAILILLIIVRLLYGF